ncbi:MULTISPECIES: hypothetical protein [Microbacterium]|uniref:hypothetical protein n=1 Tax=Microbacterium TaxID=33882 RepID=UPI0025E96898|nr:MULTISPECIES: hypothetical protein [Microbacterium]
MSIHKVARDLNASLGPTMVAALAGSKDRKLPFRWAKDDGPEPRADAARRLTFAHRQWAILVASDGEQVARQWFVGGNPLLHEDTPITAIREDRHSAVADAVRSFISWGLDE